MAKAGQLMKSIDTDPVFLKKNGASLEDFQNVNKILAREAGLQFPWNITTKSLCFFH